MATQGKNKEITYNNDWASLLLQMLLKGNGSNVTTTEGGGLTPEAIAALQAAIAGMGGVTMPAGVKSPGVPGVSPTITPEQLAAIFSQGAEQVPNLTAAYANAAGARSSNNSGLQLALDSLNEELVRQSALAGQAQQRLSTEAATANANSHLQAGQINAQMAAAFGQINAQIMAERLRAQTALAQAQKEPVVQYTRDTGGTDPTKLILGGVLLNQADKRGWFDKLWGTKDGKDDSTAKALDSAFDLSQPTTTDLAMPSMDYSLGTNIGMNPLNATFGNWQMPSMEFSMPDYSMPSYDFGLPSYDFEMPEFPSFDYGDYDFGDGYEWYDDGGDTGNWWDEVTNWMEFADGGQPMRTRNRANLGAMPPIRLQGVANRTDVPADYRGLVAPIRLSGGENRSAAEAYGTQLAEHRAMLEEINRQQQARRAEFEARRQAAIDERRQREQESYDTADGGNDSTEAPTNMSFNPAVASATKGILGAGALVSSLVGGPALAGVAALANADSNEDAATASGIGGIKLANPVLGMIASAINSARQRREAERMRAEAELAKAQHQADVAAAGDGPGGYSGGPGEDAATADAMAASGWTREYGWGSERGGGNFSDRGPGGSSGESGAAEGGASARGPGDGMGNDLKDGGSPARGGLISGPGTGTSDSIPMPMAKVSNGEYIVSADVVNRLGVGFFDNLQKAFHSGGAPK